MGKNIVLSLVIAVVTSALPARAAPPASDRALTQQHLIAIDGGRRLNIVCIGEGAPTVVFLQGAGSQIRDWSAVQPAIAKRTRACFYDRAGYGFSDPANRPMTLKTVTQDLRALLTRASIPAPYILVGHSIGGFYATYYADVYGSDVAGMVLVDPAFAGAFEFPRAPADGIAFHELVVKTFDQVFGCASLARAATLTKAEPHGCFLVPPDTDAAQDALLDRFTKPGLYDAELLEIEATSPIGDAVPTDAVEEREAARDFGAMPLVVLTAGKPSLLPGLSDAANAVYRARWLDGHQRLSIRSTRGSHSVVEGAAHFVQIDQPQTVVDAILSVLATVRSSAKAH